MRTQWIALVAAGCLTTTLGAQTQQPTTAPTGTPAAVDRGGNQTLHITGCVARPEAAAVGADARAGNAGFVLTGARMSNDSPTGTSAATAEETRQAPAAAVQPGASHDAHPAASLSAAAAGTRYVLKGNTATLTPHVGHQVEITGRFDSTVAYPHGVTVGTSGTGAAAPAAPGAASGSKPAVPTDHAVPAAVEVESVRMLAATCTATP